MAERSTAASPSRATDGPRSPQAVAVVVLAAGVGRRLAEGDGGGPKWLTEVAGRPIAEHQLAGLELALDDRCCAVVIGGHGIDRLRHWLDGRPTHFPVRIRHNADHVRRNNWYSLLLGLELLAEEGWQGTVAVLNSDLCAEPGWFSPFLDHVRSDPSDRGTLAVDFERPLTDEAMKVEVRVAGDGAERCTHIGKTGVVEPRAEYVGMAGFGPGAWRRLRAVLASFCDRDELADAWYESAIQILMERERVVPWAVPHGRWTEIDDRADLAVARRLMARS